MRIIRLLVVSLASVLAAGCTNPRTEANVATALNDAANEIGALKNDLAQLQVELDSLKATVAKQDTLVTRIMAVNNIPR
jgi:outer membrane murein-binding lipoprotein Lpp